MFRLRYRVFGERLGWRAGTAESFSQDEFDNDDALYVVGSDQGEVLACARLTPTTGPYMLRNILPRLVKAWPLPRSNKIWEVTRLAVEPTDADPLSAKLICAIAEAGFFLGADRLLCLVDAKLEELLRSMRWDVECLGEPYKPGSSAALPGMLPLNERVIAALRERAHQINPILDTGCLSRLVALQQNLQS